MTFIRFRAGPGSYLAFLGRISAEKRPDLAIDIASASRVCRLRYAAKIDKVDRDYFTGRDRAAS